MALTQIKTNAIADDAITEDKILNDAVTAAKIPANAIGASELADNAVDTAAIADDAVTQAKVNVSINRKLIINGAMTVAQRGTTSTASDYGTVDRFKLVHAGTDEAPTQEQVDVASGTTPYTLGFRKAFKITNGNQTSGAGASDNTLVRYKVEAQDIANSGWNYLSSSSNITLSFWVKSSVAQNFYGNLIAPDGTDSYNYAIETGSLTAITWTKITKTISGNSNLTFNNDIGVGLQMDLWAFAGTTYTDSGVTLNQWSVFSSGGRMPDNTSTWYTTNDATFEVTGFQLEVGSTASPFNHETYAETLRKCQRYLYVLDLGTVTNIIQLPMHRLNVSTGAPQHYINWPVVMRDAPTMSKEGTSLSWTGYQSNISLGAVLPSGGCVVGDTATASGDSSWHRVNNTSGSTLRYLFKAEL